MATPSGHFRTGRCFAMALRKPATRGTQKSAKKKSKGFTDEERAAMKERAQEVKAAARRGPRGDKSDEESAVLAKIAEMPQPDRAMGERLHAVVKAAPQPSRRDSGTGCPRTPRTARSSASSRARTSSRPGTRRSASATRRASTKAPCGRPPSL